MKPTKTQIASCIPSLDLAHADGISPAHWTSRLLGVDLWRSSAWLGLPGVLFVTQTPKDRALSNRGYSVKALAADQEDYVAQPRPHHRHFALVVLLASLTRVSPSHTPS